MYRKQLRMARGKGEVETPHGLRSLFVERVVKLPMVHVAWDYASNAYATVKESNRLVNFTLTNAEKSVAFMVGQSKPVVMRFGKQIQAVDDLACKGLGTLEEKVPLIMKSPEEIIDDTRDLYSNTVTSRYEGLVKYGTDKVRAVTDYGVHTASVLLDNRVVSSLLGRVDGALDITENYVDYFLPPKEEEETNNHHDATSNNVETKSNKPEAVERLFRIATVIRIRSFRTATLLINGAKDRLLNAPEHLLSITIENIEIANRYARNLWVVLSSEEKIEDQDSRNFLMKHLVPVARPIVKQLVSVYITVSTMLPLPSQKGKDANNGVNNNSTHTPTVVDSMTEGAMRVIGLVRTIPALLPVYLYIVFSWLAPEKDTKPKSEASSEKRSENNCAKSEHNYANEHNHDNHYPNNN